jgi:hypothetical protein
VNPTLRAIALVLQLASALVLWQAVLNRRRLMERYLRTNEAAARARGVPSQSAAYRRRLSFGMTLLAISVALLTLGLLDQIVVLARTWLQSVGLILQFGGAVVFWLVALNRDQLMARYIQANEEIARSRGASADSTAYRNRLSIWRKMLPLVASLYTVGLMMQIYALPHPF